MSDWIRIGAKCVCVKTTPWRSSQITAVCGTAPQHGDVLTVRAILDGPNYELFLLFEEIPTLDAWWSIWFRPVTETEEPARRHAVIA